MNELVIKTHDFEVAKNGLKEFSEQTTTDLDLKKVDTSKGIGEWFSDWLKGGGISTNHKVTGAELNELTTQIQKHLIDINTLHRKLIQEFGQVYNALEALDKDYIQAILVSIKATEETSKRIETTQEQIKKIVEDQKKTLEVLKKFKQKLDNYAHLEDIDKLWNEYQKCHKDISDLSKLINDVSSIGNKNTKRIDALSSDYKNLDINIKALVDIAIESEVVKNDNAVQSLSKKIKYAYLLAGGSLGLAVIELIVLLMKVI